MTEWTANSTTQITVLQGGMGDWSWEGCRDAVGLGLDLKNEEDLARGGRAPRTRRTFKKRETV